MTDGMPRAHHAARTLHEACVAYAEACEKQAKATAVAQAASARYTAERSHDAREDMRVAWQKADRAMRVEFEALRALGDAAREAVLSA